MEIFGPRWKDYIQKIEKNWRAVVSPEDTVIIPGDISWSLKLEDTLEDFRFLEALPGTKLIGKGNHDFWWSTAAKMTSYFAQHGIKSLRIFYNNAYLVEDCIVCGARDIEEAEWFAENADAYCQVLLLAAGHGGRLQQVGPQSVKDFLAIRKALGLPLAAGQKLYNTDRFNGYRMKRVGK